MRIGIDIRTLMDKKYSGISEYCFHLLEEIFQLDLKNEYILFYNSFKNVSQRIPQFKNDNVKIINTRYPSKFFNYILQKLFQRPELDHLLDVDVFFMPHMNFFALSANSKSIITIHDLSFMFYPEFFSFKKNIWHRAINIKKNLKKFDYIIAISDNTKKDLIKFCHVDEKKIKVIYSGISKDLKKIDPTNSCLDKVRLKYGLPKKFILYLATVEPRKNVDGLIKAYEKLMDENIILKDFGLVIAGARGWKYKKTMKYWEKSRYRHKIKFTSYIDAEDKVYLYNLATIFVYPTFYEGFGFPPLEAMACGIPVIASANSSLTEILGNAPVFINPYDVNSIKQAIKEIVNNYGFQQKMIKRGYVNIERFNWKNTAKEFLKLINKY